MKFPFLISLVFLLASSEVFGQLLHTSATCPTGMVSGSVSWNDPAGAEEFDWTNRATTYTANNVSGTQVDVTYTWTGQTGTFTDYIGILSPDVTTTLTSGEEAVTFVTSGYTTGMTLTMTLSPPIPGYLGYEIYHMNKDGNAGDQYTISATTTSGNTIYPTFTANGTPSWATTATAGNIDGNASSTAGQNDQVGVNFNSNEFISSVTMKWEDCSTCNTSVLHGAAFGAFSFCIDDWDKDGVHNISDIDDDNDGILDTDEQCSNSNAGGTLDWDSENWSSGSTTGSFTVAGVTVSASFSSTGSALSSINDETTYTGGVSPAQNALRYTVNQPSRDDIVTSTWKFSDAVDDLSFSLYDVDADGTNHIDDIRIVGYAFGSVVLPTLGTSSSNTVTENRAFGNASSGNTSSNGNVTVLFPEMIDSMAIYLSNTTSATSNPSTQGIAIHDMTWTRSCPSFDADNDGIPNHLDADSENDGVFDLYESGISSTLIASLDANNDGIIDVSVSEGTNGLANSLETGSDNGVLNYSYADTDNDGTLNRFDLDSDNDGIYDVVENGNGTDANSDGIVDGSGDDDNDGIINSADNDDTDLGSPSTAAANVDGDAYPNFIDVDSDNDGIVDNVEAQATTGSPRRPLGTDSDGDGIDNNFESGNILTPVDTDGDGTADYLDTDSDNDGDSDLIEAYDTDNNGTTNTSLSGTDTDGDGLDNNFDAINGWNSTTNVTNNSQSALSFPNLDLASSSERDWREATDIDGDGVADGSDLDSDNDGIPDATEGGGDVDGDGIPNYRDTDSDGDGIADIVEAGGEDINNDGKVDGFTDVATSAGYSDNTSCSSTALTISSPTSPTATDDGYVTVALPFSFDFFANSFTGNLRWNMNGWVSFDNISPGTPYTAVTFPNGTFTNTIALNLIDISPNNGGTISYGTNGTTPNRILIINYSATPFFSGSGSATMQLQLHETSNEIRIVTTNFNPSTGNATQGLNQNGSSSFNVTGRNNASYTITTAECRSFTYSTGNPKNGIHDAYDSSPLTPADTDGDGIPNYLDVDSDNDGLTDNVEAQSTAAFTAPSGSDTDTDGWDNSYDSNNGGTAISLNNDDAAGNSDYLDTDSDGDGSFDWLEGFDDNSDGNALADFVSRAAAYETANSNPGNYPTTDSDNDGIPNWLEDADADGIPNFLDFGSGHFVDSDGDGLVNLFDPTNNGVASSLPDLDGINDVDFRDPANAPHPLPIDLLSFNAVPKEGKVYLTWTTLSEINNDYFIVQRSQNGKDFKFLHKIKGKGTTNDQHDYTDIDEFPYSGVSYYRLKQTDFNGESSYSDIRKVVFEEGLNARSIQFFPNPASNELYFKFSNVDITNLQVTITDVSGRVLLTESLTGNENSNPNKLDLPNLPNGNYFIKLFSPSEVFPINKLIISH